MVNNTCGTDCGEQGGNVHSLPFQKPRITGLSHPCQVTFPQMHSFVHINYHFRGAKEITIA